MEILLQTLIAFFAANGVVPPEVHDDDDNREGSYLYELPTKPNNALSFNIYGQLLPAFSKEFQLIHLHIVIRNEAADVAASMAQKLFEFIVSLADPTKDWIQDIQGSYFIFDIRSGPTRLLQDEHQNSLWSLSVPIKCKLGGVYGQSS